MTWRKVLQTGSILQSDETQPEVCGHRDAANVWRKNGENSVPTVKHGGGSIMLWRYFSEL